MDPEYKRLRQIEATRRWRDKNPDKVAEANKKPRKRIRDPQKSRDWRLRRLQKEGYRERVNAIDNARRTAIRRWLDEYKIKHGCVDCGYKSHPVALHFDHVTGNKRFNVCNARSKQQAESEIAKCIVRCANCHAVKTWPRPIHTSP